MNSEVKITWIRYSNREQLVDHAADNFDRMVAGLVADGVSAEDTTTGQRRRLSNSGVVVLKWQYVLAEESTECMSCETNLEPRASSLLSPYH